MRLYVSLLSCFLILLSLSVLPYAAYAASVPHEAGLLRQIRALQKQLSELQSRIDTQSNPEVLGASTAAIEHQVSKYYEGTYDSVYDYRFGPIASQIRTQNERIVWRRFSELLGTAFTQSHVQEFRVFTDPDATYDAYVERDQVTQGWIFGFNMYDVYFDNRESVPRDIDELLIHEISHIFFSESSEIEDLFAQRFWEDGYTASHKEETTHSETELAIRARTRYELYPEKYVSEYAATSAHEDVAESYVRFVSEPGRFTNRLVDQKVNFFYQFPELINKRAQMRSVMGISQ